MQAFDASSIIHAWDNYPIDQFPPLWNWVAQQIEAGAFAISSVACDEVGHKIPGCEAWLKKCAIRRIEITNEILNEAMRLKGMLGVQDDKYHAKGVDENDLLIIAAALIIGAELISDEGRQLRAPQEIKKLKVPAVCGLNGVDVPCFSFLELIKRSKVVFK